MMMNDPYYVIVVDHDNKAFDVLGPMHDDSAVTSDVSKGQERGRQVNCFATQCLSKPQIIQDYTARTGYAHRVVHVP